MPNIIQTIYLLRNPLQKHINTASHTESQIRNHTAQDIDNYCDIQ